MHITCCFHASNLIKIIVGPDMIESKMYWSALNKERWPHGILHGAVGSFSPWNKLYVVYCFKLLPNQILAEYQDKIENITDNCMV